MEIDARQPRKPNSNKQPKKQEPKEEDSLKVLCPDGVIATLRGF